MLKKWYIRLGGNVQMADYDVIMKIREEIPNFDEKELMDLAKTSIPAIHALLVKGKTKNLQEYCVDTLIDKFLNNNALYRLSEDIDGVRVEFARLDGCIHKEDKFYVRVYASIYFYDNVDNNYDNVELFDKYWNDVWIITYEGNESDKANSIKSVVNQCPTCGAFMNYNSYKKVFKCDYCGNTICYAPIKWKMVDIEVRQ